MWELILVVAVLAGSCKKNEDAAKQAASTGGSRAAKPAASGIHGYDCDTLISPKEIDEIIGASGTRRLSGVRGDENDALPGHTDCGYALPADLTLGVSVYSGTGSGEAMETFEVVWDKAVKDGAQPAPGVGDEARLQPDVLGGPRLLARAKNRGVIVLMADASGSGKIDLAAATKRVAAIVAGRL